MNTLLLWLISWWCHLVATFNTTLQRNYNNATYFTKNLAYTLFEHTLYSIWGQYSRKWASLVAQTVRNLPAMPEMRIQSLGQKVPLEKGMTTHLSTLDWRIPWTEEPGGLHSTGHKESDTIEWLTLSICTEASLVAQWQKVCGQFRRHRSHPWVGKIPWRREWQPTPVFLPGEFHRQRSLAIYSPQGHQQSDTTERLNWTELKQSKSFLPRWCQWQRICLTMQET